MVQNIPFNCIPIHLLLVTIPPLPGRTARYLHFYHFPYTPTTVLTVLAGLFLITTYLYPTTLFDYLV